MNSNISEYLLKFFITTSIQMMIIKGKGSVSYIHKKEILFCLHSGRPGQKFSVVKAFALIKQKR